LWPLSRAAGELAGYDDFPPLEALGRVFEADPPVRFVSAAPRRRRGAPIEARALYDARIVLDGEVPTRACCWHDLMNVLVWGTFPRAKRALHARQHRAIAERLVPGARTLPAVRTPELDALALLDEGGVVVLSCDGDGLKPPSARPTVVFGHAVYESLVLGVAPAVVAAVALTLPRPAWPSSPYAAATSGRDGPVDHGADVVRAVDRALAATIEDAARLRTPRAFSRAVLPSFAPYCRP
jgi:hypothetical protein